MQQSQVLTYGIEGVISERLREAAQAHRFWLRETSQFAACRNVVQTSPPSVIVLVLGRDLEKELALIEQIHASLPSTKMIAVGESDNPVLAGLAWDLGAAYVLFPPTPRERLTELVLRLLPGASP